MSKIRVNKNQNYTVMSNYHLREKDMSLKAKGLLSVMLSLPDNWDYSINGLCSICKENETAIKSALEELKQFGYLNVTKLMPNETNTGRIEYLYDIYEEPRRSIQDHEKQGIENLPLEILPVENQGQLNTKELNTKELNKVSKKERECYNSILSKIEDEELKELYIEYIKMRKLIKSPLTNKALKMLIDKVNQLEPVDIERQKQLLKTAIMNGWKDVYPFQKTSIMNGWKDVYPVQSKKSPSKSYSSRSSEPCTPSCDPSYDLLEYENSSIFD